MNKSTAKDFHRDFFYLFNETDCKEILLNDLRFHEYTYQFCKYFFSTNEKRFIFWQNKMENTRNIKYLKVLKIIHNGCDHLPKMRLSIEKIKL